ncbi:hypothetical protein LP420_29945 [Massilia sp. B-10]|nr:hypothetical protein LP420_29945 [Massilia sp. B-10]
MLSLAKPGDKVTLDVWREGKTVRIDARLANADDKVANAERGELATADNSARLGLALRPLDPNEKRQSGIAA